MLYSIEEHRHRFAAWAASRAASVINCRFKVEQGKKIIELSGLMEIGAHINNLPYPNNFDEKHREWRYSIIKQAQKYQTSFYTWRCCKIVKVDNINLCKKRERRSNADKLWDVVKDLWPINSQWQTIYEIKELAPIGTAGIDNRSSYDFAMLTMLSTVRRNFVIHELISTEKK